MSASRSGIWVRPQGEPAEIHFLFEQREKRLGGALGASVLSHLGFALCVLVLVRMAPEPAPGALPDLLRNEIVWLVEPGPGGGGGGGGNKMPEPPKKAELPGKEKLTVPATPAAAPQITETKPEEPQAEQTLNIPAKTMGVAMTTSPGALESTQASDLVSQGLGIGGGAGTGAGTGIGSGQGSGLGPGFGGGTGGGAYRPGNGIETPKLVSEVRPNYTAEAMRAKVQGVALLECVVLPSGSVGNCTVKRSLDRNFGLDEEALKAAKQWRFMPGTRFGDPVPVLVSIEISFALR